MKICPACEAANSQEANFCALCRAPFQRSSRGAYCDKGHAMHPSWHECLECKGERSQVQDFGSVPPRMPTVMEPGMAAAPRMATIVEVSAETTTPAVAYPPPPPPVAPRATGGTAPARVRPPAPEPDEPPPVVSRSRTQFAHTPTPTTERKEAQLPPPPPPVAAPSSPAAPSPQVSGRRIVGLLITYTWNPDGQIFPLREGRNLIGRNSACDISLPQDSHLSDTNTHVTYRKNFTVGDLVSMGGTDLNGDPIEENFVRLPNYARIRAGSTQFLFISAEAAGSDQTA